MRLGDRYSYEDWMNHMATDVGDEEPRRTVKRWRGRTFVYFTTEPTNGRGE